MAEDFDVSSSFIASLYKPQSLLPIARHRQKLLYAIETFPITIVVGQTGSGKSTQIPQFLDQAGWCQDGNIIAVTQVCKSTARCLNMNLYILELTESSLAVWRRLQWQPEWQKKWVVRSVRMLDIQSDSKI